MSMAIIMIVKVIHQQNQLMMKNQTHILVVIPMMIAIFIQINIALLQMMTSQMTF